MRVKNQIKTRKLVKGFPMGTNWYREIRRLVEKHSVTPELAVKTIKETLFTQDVS